jgi:glycosyltransferase involved in cell wall biosynthesis
MTLRWHILTPELPPECGGVGDYTVQVAEALSQSGDSVSVYSPLSASPWHGADGVESIALPDRFGPGTQQALTSILTRDPASRLLIQYVPAVFGNRGRNLPFCRWVRSRARAGVDVRVMFHEPYLYFRWRPDHILTALVQRSMARALLDPVPVVYLSTDTWRRYLAAYGPNAISLSTTLPIPSAISRALCPQAARAVRHQALGRARYLIGHFGTYGRHVAPLLRRIVQDLLASAADLAVLCVGAGSDAFAKSVVSQDPAVRDRIAGTGRIAPHDVSVNLQACDVLVQPYPDGVTTRRTSVMAGLANRRAVVTNDGPLTEDIWRGTGCVALAASPAGIAASVRGVLRDAAARASLETRALATYESTFDLRHTVDALRGIEAAVTEGLCGAGVQE